MDKPRIKPLVWDLWDGGMTVAKTIIGTYNLSPASSLRFPNGSYLYYETEEAAKAAAQADYEARILAALEPVTVQEAARVLLDAIDDGEVWRVYMNAMTPILRADMSADAWNTVAEIRAAFASALRALAAKDT